MTFDPGLVYSDCAGPCQRQVRLRRVWISWFGHTFPLALCRACQVTLVRDLLLGKALRSLARENCRVRTVDGAE